MPKWWKIGFASVLLLTTGAFFTHLALKDPALTGEHEGTGAEFKSETSLPWDWSYEELTCKEFDRCVFLEVENTSKCKNQTIVEAYLADANDDWVATADTVMPSPNASDVALIELGVNREDFEFFFVGDVRCTAALPTVEAVSEPNRRPASSPAAAAPPSLTPKFLEFDGVMLLDHSKISPANGFPNIACLAASQMRS